MSTPDAATIGNNNVPVDNSATPVPQPQNNASVDAPDINNPTSPTPTVPGVTDTPSPQGPSSLPAETFRQGMASDSAPYRTTATGQVERDVPAYRPSVKGVLGHILMGALEGASRGIAATTPEGARGYGGAASAGAAAAAQGRIAADAKARAIAQQNFENQQNATAQKVKVQQDLAETAHITQVMSHEKDMDPGILRAQKLGNESAAIQIEGANTRMLTDAAEAIDALAKIDAPLQFYTDHVPALNAQIPGLVNGDMLPIQNGKRGDANGVALIPKNFLNNLITSPITYNTYDGARDKDGAPIPTANVITPDGKATMMKWADGYYKGRHQLYQMQNKTSADMTLQQHKAAQEQSESVSAKNRADANLANAEAANLKNTGITLPETFKKPDGFIMPEDQLKSNLASQGVKTPDDFDQLYAVAHYTGDLSDYPERVTKGTGQKSRAQAVTQIRALGLNSNFDEKTYPAIRKQVEEYASTKPGTAGGNIVAYNTALSHLDHLYDAAQALHNHDARLWNKTANWYKLQAGASPKVVFDTIQSALVGEVGKTYEGGKPDVQTADEIRKNFNSSMSNGQLDSFAKTTAALMQSKNNQLAQQYFNWTGKLNPNAVNPSSTEIYKKMGLDPYQGLPKAEVSVGGTGNQNPNQIPNKANSPVSAPTFRNRNGQSFPLDNKGQFVANGWLYQASPDGSKATPIHKAQ